jgi:hypothetical protein
MILSYITLFLIIHIIYMIRNRAKLRWGFIVPSGVPKPLTCRSVGSGTQGAWVVSLYMRMAFEYIEVGECIVLIHGWGVGGRWWQPCPSFVIPHVRLGCRSLNCHMRLLADQYSVASRTISHVELDLNHVHVWSLTVLFISLSRPCLLHEIYSFILYSFFSFILAHSLSLYVCRIIMKSMFIACHKQLVYFVSMLSWLYPC